MGERPEVDGDDPLLDDLTQAQRKAVLHVDGPLLVLAGPGSGKTRVITRRIAHLVRSGVRPWRILALTFTNKAAGEMRHRVEALLGAGAAERGLTVTTFHSLCVRLLRKYAEQAGLTERGILKPGFTIYDDDDQMRLVKGVIALLDLSTANWPARGVLATISGAKNELQDAEAFAARAADFHGRTVARVYRGYEHALRQANAVDFDDLLLLTARMLRESATVRAEVQARWRYLLVDEYQDTNRAQFVIASLIAGEKGPRADDPGPNICVVGDPDQSIYGWRGADITNILQFEEQYPGAIVIALGENFRSRAQILTAADRLIRRNACRKPKPLTPTRGTGSPVEVVLCRDEHHEASLVLDWMKRLREEGIDGRPVDWKDCAVFYRTNALSRVVEDTLRGAGVPYVMVRGTAFYQREEVRNALAYLRLVANPSDAVSLERIINTPARGISDATWDKIVSHCAATGQQPMEALRRLAGGGEIAGVTPRAAAAVGKFLQTLDSWSGANGAETELIESGEAASLADLVGRIVRESGLEDMYRTEEERLENLGELVSSARDFEAEQSAALADEGAMPADDNPLPPATEPAALSTVLAAYLERVALVADTDAIDPASGAVTLMTLHAAKGLEFPVVAMTGLEEGVLPHIRAQQSESELEEERRLAFVGVTRAMDRLLITSASFRTVRGIAERTITSRFVEELEGDGVTVSNQADRFGGGESDPAMERFLRGRGGGTAVTVSSARQEQPFPPGSIVRHPQFGRGVVQTATSGTNARVQVKFDHVGVKTLVLEYARLQRIK